MRSEIIHRATADRRTDALANAAATSLRMGSGGVGTLRRGAIDPINEGAISRGLDRLDSEPIPEQLRSRKE